MGLKWSRVNVEGQIRALAQASNEFHGMIGDAMEEIAPEVEERMVMYSDARKNRISGNMADDLGAEVSKSQLQLRFGFIKRFQDYYNYQTIRGFTHWRSGEFIEPSLAIKDAKYDAENLMRDMQKRVRRNFMQRLRRRG